MSKKLIYLVLVVLFIYFVSGRYNDGKVLLDTLYKANWIYILLALGMQWIHYFLGSLLYQKTLKLYGTHWSLGKIAKLNLSSLSINVFTPLSPFPGSMLFIKSAREEGTPALNIVATTFLVVLFDYLALCPLLVLSLYLQSVNNNIFIYEILGVLVFVTIIILLSAILLFGILSPSILGWFFVLLESLANKLHYIFKKRSYLIKGWSESRTMHFIELSRKLLESRGKKLNLFLISLTRHTVDMLTLYFIFAAFGLNIPTSVLFVGYSLMLLFWVVTPTPQGVGFVEAIAPAIFSSMGIRLETATLAVLVFRGLNLWLPLIIGFIILPGVLKSASDKT